ncbi:MULTISPECIES: hypothetical protein [unclassified Duganella]|uniref:hypothetical protein n=1 Tax=unclassified Duganella TaxID=2636909 RepID=UPI0006F754DF|nr:MULTISPECIES: hypothetical protein [unclassified Duganella]KQV59307.1 hypothetical protein ASD07_24100 [Duganella sp. Root336D2]KRC01407.1 hypothetical protein ASE26_20475 [Duganella sp. Root198D2]
MFGSRQETQHSGTVERIGFAYTGENSGRYVLLLHGEATPIVLQGGAMFGEYERVIELPALTAPGDKVEVTLKGKWLKCVSNETQQKRLTA